MKTPLYIQVDDELASVYERLKRFSKKKIHVVIPPRAYLFQSVVNLKLLKERLEKKGNELVVITKDRIGKHLCRQAGLQVQESAQIQSVQASAEVESPEKPLIEPIQARRNEIHRELPQRVEKKVTIGEVIRELRQTKKSAPKKPLVNILAYTPRSKSRFLAFVLLGSAFLFLAIAYVALPDATIYIRPSFETISHSVNVTLADINRNQNLLSQNNSNVVAAQNLVRQVNETRVFNASSKVFNGTNAQGVITLVNEAEESWELRSGTRFQSPEGLIFKSKGAIKVPPAFKNGSGTLVPARLDVAVEADPFDAYGKEAGERANIAPTTFVLPALSRYDQERIHGQSSSPMTGGVSLYSTVVQEQDVEAAKRQMEEGLSLIAKKELHSYVEELNRLNGTRLALLDKEPYIKIALDEMRVSEGVAGTFRDKFEVFAQLTAQGIGYDFDQLFSLLKKELRTRTHPDMKLREESIKPQNIHYESVEGDEKAMGNYEQTGQLKITATVQGIQEYDIDTETQAGLRFSNRIREKVLGVSLEEAEIIIGNLPEVDAVKIKAWPFWVSHLPRVADNIQVKLLEE